jgi:prophage maintenance system killer protein
MEKFNENGTLYKRRRRITHIVSRQNPRTNSTDVCTTYVTYVKFVSHVGRNSNKRTQIKANFDE